MKVLSLGAGVQSTTLLLMAHEGEIEKPDVAIFADTQWEPKAVYEHLAWLESVSSIPIERVTAGNLRADALAGKSGHADMHFAIIPLFCKSEGGPVSQLGRQCTSNYKIRPVRRRIRELLSSPRPLIDVFSNEKPHAELWMGISLDEAHRMRDSDVQYITNRYPLIERRMTRWDCLLWLERHGYPTPPKSACIGCPYHGGTQWRAIKADPDAWADAVSFDHDVRDIISIEGKSYLHRSAVPLSEVDLTTPQERGQQDMFGEECEGMCGV